MCEGEFRTKKKDSAVHKTSDLMSPYGDIDWENTELREIICKIDWSILVHHYRLLDQMDRCIEILKSNMKLSKISNVDIIKEILYTYIYFEKYPLACRYIDCNIKSDHPMYYIKYILDCGMLLTRKECNDDSMFRAVLAGFKLKKKVIFLKYLKRYYEINCKGCFHECFFSKMMILNASVDYETLKKHTYKELLELYRYLPDKSVVLKRMVHVNSYIKKKYYIEYAKYHGIWRVDIKRIIETRYCRWAMRIAWDHGWIDENNRVLLEKHFGWQDPVFINKKGMWSNISTGTTRIPDGKGEGLLTKPISFAWGEESGFVKEGVGKNPKSRKKKYRSEHTKNIDNDETEDIDGDGTISNSNEDVL